MAPLAHLPAWWGLSAQPVKGTHAVGQLARPQHSGAVEGAHGDAVADDPYLAVDWKIDADELARRFDPGRPHRLGTVQSQTGDLVLVDTHGAVLAHGQWYVACGSIPQPHRGGRWYLCWGA